MLIYKDAKKISVKIELEKEINGKKIIELYANFGDELFRELSTVLDIYLAKNLTNIERSVLIEKLMPNIETLRQRLDYYFK